MSRYHSDNIENGASTLKNSIITLGQGTLRSTTAELLNTWQGHVGYAAGLLLRSLREKAHQWWYFLDHPEIPPDNNLAERSRRLAVTKRKVSGGSRSMSRFEQTADLLSVIQTCRFQGIRAIDFFRDALSAHSCDLFMPSLIPQS